jgi:hypothetical protein
VLVLVLVLVLVPVPVLDPPALALFPCGHSETAAAPTHSNPQKPSTPSTTPFILRRGGPIPGTS